MADIQLLSRSSGAELYKKLGFDPELEARLSPEQGARWLQNYVTVMTMELQTIARACGKSHVLNLEPEDMVALTIEAAAMAGVPLAGTDWIPGRSR